MSSRPSIPFLLELLRLAMQKEAAALYLVPWMPPTLRIDERSLPLSSASLAPEQSTLLVLDLLDGEHRAALDRSREIEFDFALDGVGRFRVHAFRRHGQPAATIRPFATEVPTPRTLALPLPACSAALAGRGLLVLASASPTLRRDALAALVEHRNRVGEGELVLLDGAARFWHQGARCRVQQGVDAAAVEALLRRRGHAAAPVPLAVAFGELRDAAQLQQAVHLAGQALCLATMDAARPLQALQRLVELARQHGGPQLLHRTAMRLHVVLALRPVPAGADGRTLAAAEMLRNSPPLAADLAEGDLHALQALLRQAQDRPPCTGPDDHLLLLVDQGLVTPEAALQHALDPAAFAQRAAGRKPPADAAAGGVQPPRAEPQVDTGFADLFPSGSAPLDPFECAEAAASAPAPDTQIQDLGWDEDAGKPGDCGDAGSANAPAPPGAVAPAKLVKPNTPPSPRSLQAQVWAPPAAAAGTPAAIDVWLSRAEDAADAARLAASGEEPPAMAARAAPGEGLAQLSVQLRIDDVLPAPIGLNVGWTGQPQRLRFALPVPARAAAGLHAARVRLAAQGLLIGELGFAFAVQPDADAGAAPENANAARRMLRSAYAAFAEADREAVARWLHPLRALAPELEVFVDAHTLRTGTDWRERIQQALAQRERLVLFWSHAAAESPWLDFEWRSVLRRRGLQAIDLVLLRAPTPAPLPPELADLPPSPGPAAAASAAQA